MAFYSGSTPTLVASENGHMFPQFSSAPASPIQGQVYFDTNLKKLYMWDGYIWGEVFEPGRAYLYRSIINTGYVMAGYQNSSPWKNVNRMQHATDICSNLNDLLPTAGAYVGGACSKTIGYVFGADSAWPGTNTAVSSFTMTTETAGTAGTYTMLKSRNCCATIFKETEYAWIIGGGDTGVDVLNLTTNTMLANQSITSMAGDSYQSGVSCLSDETKGFVWGDANHKFTFSTSAAVSINTSGAVTGSGSQQKGINSKLHKGWNGNEGSYNGGYNLKRWDLTTETSLGTVVKPVGNSGEENFDMGQDHQYMMGCYDGAQNNRGWKFSYTTETGYELGTGSIRTGVAGGSSGACAWKGA
jgi:hypothetical protein